jgi:molybdopterin synthase catalytic subunit
MSHPKNIFVNGPISPETIAASIASHSSKTEIGAHSIFLGQIRQDVQQQTSVTTIEYTAYETMALLAAALKSQESNSNCNFY